MPSLTNNEGAMAMGNSFKFGKWSIIGIGDALFKRFAIAVFSLVTGIIGLGTSILMAMETLITGNERYSRQLRDLLNWIAAKVLGKAIGFSVKVMEPGGREIDMGNLIQAVMAADAAELPEAVREARQALIDAGKSNRKTNT